MKFRIFDGAGLMIDAMKVCKSPAVLAGALLIGGFPGRSLADDALTYRGITFYGTVDIGIAHLSHGAPLSATYGPGLPFMIQKNSNRPITSVVSNGLSQSKAGVSGIEPLLPGWSAVFKLETGFQPASGRLADGPASLVVNNGKALDKQTTSGDSSRAGQVFQGPAYVGVSSRTFGTLTFGRQNALLADSLLKYDPQLAAQAFSPLGYSGVAGGMGDTEDRALDQTIKYALAHGPVHLVLLHQSGSAGFIPEGANEVAVGADYAGLSVDALYSKVQGAIAAASLTAAQAALAPGTLAATVSDNTAYSLLGSYAWGPARLYAGYEHIKYGNPAHPLENGAVDIGGYVLSTVNNTAYGINRILEISWFGARYFVTPRFEITGAYYHYDQNSYNKNGCSDNSATSCSGTYDQLSAVADYHLSKRFDTYFGINYSAVADGLASGYLNTASVGPMTGVRFKF